MVFGAGRNVLEVVTKFQEFFVEESCGYCTPCRVGNVLLKERLDKIIAGHGEPSDIDYLEELATTVKVAGRCGLGQAAPNPILTTLKVMRPIYDALVSESADGLQRSFDIHAALEAGAAIAERSSVHFEK